MIEDSRIRHGWVDFPQLLRNYRWKCVQMHPIQPVIPDLRHAAALASPFPSAAFIPPVNLMDEYDKGTNDKACFN